MQTFCLLGAHSDPWVVRFVSLHPSPGPCDVAHPTPLVITCLSSVATMKNDFVPTEWWREGAVGNPLLHIRCVTRNVIQKNKCTLTISGSKRPGMDPDNNTAKKGEFGLVCYSAHSMRTTHPWLASFCTRVSYRTAASRPREGLSTTVPTQWRGK